MKIAGEKQSKRQTAKCQTSSGNETQKEEMLPAEMRDR